MLFKMIQQSMGIFLFLRIWLGRSFLRERTVLLCTRRVELKIATLGEHINARGRLRAKAPLVKKL